MRLKRRVFSVLAATPLLVCLLLCWMSVRGGLWGPYEGFARDVVDPARRERVHYGFRTNRRGIEMGHRRLVYANDRYYQSQVVQNGIRTRTWGGGDLMVQFNVDIDPRLERLGFAVGHEQGASRIMSYELWAFRLPYWALAVAMLVPHGLVIANGLRKQRRINWRKHGRCAGCGYDLRWSESRCPECGRDVRLAPWVEAPSPGAAPSGRKSAS